ncbi:helix-turn-helix domain-containing protein [Ferrimicrobium sp.]|uniref:helix-turn-helix domain-containing protein n=2 Tax=Ferrimicrobium sp. TaxID=2926050 RepID=UPI00260B0CAA|nr:helix-turn-helix domain-containing protein [Ferrimicrobium sp.]
MRRKPFRDEQIELAVELYGEGLSVMEVGRRLGVSGSTVNNALLRNNVAMRKPWEHPLHRTVK